MNITSFDGYMSGDQKAIYLGMKKFFAVMLMVTVIYLFT